MTINSIRSAEWNFITRMGSTILVIILGVIALQIDQPSYLVSTFVIISFGALIAVLAGFFSFRFISYVIIFYPALTPFYCWDLMGGEIFSTASVHLQSDLDLINRLTFIFAIASVSFFLFQFSMTDREKPTMNRLILRDYQLVIVGLVLLVVSYLLESGPTVLTANYQTILDSRIERSTLVVFAISFFGVLWVLLFAFGRHRSKIFYFFTGIVFLWLLLHVRRVELLGIAVLLILWLATRFPKWAISLVLFVLISGLIFLELVRSQSLSSQESVSELISDKLSRKTALPGGASNIYLSGLHIVNETDGNRISEEARNSLFQHILSPIPNSVRQVLALPALKTEHDMIFEELDLNYVGGLPLISVFYLNGGLMLVIFFGVLHGLLAVFVDRILLNSFYFDSSKGGTFLFFVVCVFVLYQFRYHWYNASTLVRAVTFGTLLFLPLRFLLNWKTIVTIFDDKLFKISGDNSK